MIRVHEVSKRLGIPNSETLQLLREMGIEDITHLSNVPDNVADQLIKAAEKPDPEPVLAPEMPNPVVLPEIAQSWNKLMNHLEDAAEQLKKHNALAASRPDVSHLSPRAQKHLTHPLNRANIYNFLKTFVNYHRNAGGFDGLYIKE